MSRYGARVLELTMKAFPDLSFSDQKKVALCHLHSGLADSDIQRETRLRLTDLGSTESDWSNAIDLITLLENEARSGISDANE